jgi:hypothetical protein
MVTAMLHVHYHKKCKKIFAMNQIIGVKRKNMLPYWKINDLSE